MYASKLGLNLRIGLAAAMASLLGACNPVDSIVPKSPRTVAGEASQMRPETSADKIVVKPMTAEDLECPVVEIEDGAATFFVEHGNSLRRIRR